MAQMPGSAGAQRIRQKAPNDIYTVLVGIALFTVLGTTGFVIYRCVELLGTAFPGLPS